MRHSLILTLLAACVEVAAADDTDWFAFNPPADTFVESPIDLRFLNEKFAGEHGLIVTRGDEFVHSASREPTRFWAVNGPPSGLSGVPLQQCARRLAKYGVNLVRMHGAIFDKAGDADPKKVSRAQETVTRLRPRASTRCSRFIFRSG